eukprot:25478_1
MTTTKKYKSTTVILFILIQILYLFVYFGSSFQHYNNGIDSSYTFNDSGQVQHDTHGRLPFTQEQEIHSWRGYQWKIHNVVNGTRYISVTNGVQERSIKIALFCVGAQATSTNSMIHQLTQVPEVVTPKNEMHWYTANCWEYHHNYDYSYALSTIFRYNISPSDEMDLWNHYCPIEGFISKFLLNEINLRKTRRLNVAYYAAKGPREIMYPSIANYYVNYYVKYYDTKLFVLLRNPVKRCIAGLVKFIFKSTNHTKHSIIKWLNESVLSTSFSQQLNTSLTRIYEAHINDSSDDIWNEIRVR